MTRLPDRFFVLTGWWLFVVSAVFFIYSAWRAGDMVALAGATAFLLADISFLIPFYRASSREDHQREE